MSSTRPRGRHHPAIQTHNEGKLAQGIHMDDRCHQRYLDAEKSFAEADYATARSLTDQLLDALETAESPEAKTPDDTNLLAAAALLRGHIALHGFNQSHEARRYYQQALAHANEQAVHDLAQQGLERSQTSTETTTLPQASDSHQTGASLILDPFLGDTAASAPADQPQATATATATATPWANALEHNVKADDQDKPSKPAEAQTSTAHRDHNQKLERDRTYNSPPSTLETFTQDKDAMNINNADQDSQQHDLNEARPTIPAEAPTMEIPKESWLKRTVSAKRDAVDPDESR